MRRILVVSAAVFLAGCGGSGESTDRASTAAAQVAAAVRSQKLAAPTAPKSRPARGPRGPDDVCHVVTAADARRWSAVPETVQDASNNGTFTDCNMVVDGERDGLSLMWRFQKDHKSFRAEVRDYARENDGRQTKLTLGNGVPAVRFDPRKGAELRIVVFTRYQGDTLEVEASSLPLSKKLTLAALRRAARELAEVYARVGKRGTPPPHLISVD